MLRLAFRQLDKAEIQTRLLVHDLQNHDELTYQLPELMEGGNEPLPYGDQQVLKWRLRRRILKEMQAKAAGDKAPWNLLYRTQNDGGDGIATTMVGFIAAGLGINPYKATEEQKKQIKRAHLLVAMANAMQPGVFSLSMWDLVGTLPLKGCDLRLMSSVNNVSGIPTAGKNLIIVAAVNNVLHFRIFDGDGKMVVDTDEKRLTEQARQIEDLKKQLESLWPPHELTRFEKVGSSPLSHQSSVTSLKRW